VSSCARPTSTTGDPSVSYISSIHIEIPTWRVFLCKAHLHNIPPSAVGAIPSVSSRSSIHIEILTLARASRRPTSKTAHRSLPPPVSHISSIHIGILTWCVFLCYGAAIPPRPHGILYIGVCSCAGPLAQRPTQCCRRRSLRLPAWQPVRPYRYRYIDTYTHLYV